LKNCSNVTDVTLYKIFVAYRNNDLILVSNIFEIRSTTEPHPISSPLSVNDIKMFEDGFNKVLDKFNVEKTSTVDILVLCTVSALIFVYIMIFTVNKRRNVVDFLGALSRHIGGNISTPNVSDIEDEAFAREQNNGSAGQQANISANNASTQVASDQLSGSAPIREESSLQSTIRSNELLSNTRIEQANNNAAVLATHANNASTQVASDQLSGSAPIREESSLQESSGAGQRKLAHSTALHITDESMMYSSTHGISIINENITNPRKGSKNSFKNETSLVAYFRCYF